MRSLRALVFLLSPALFANPPGPIAIRNARIVPVSGAVIDKGTVVLRDGLIEAVGATVTIPADAWVIEGDGLTVYPGLIDALSTFGIPEAAPATPSGSANARTSIVRLASIRDVCPVWHHGGRPGDSRFPGDGRRT